MQTWLSHFQRSLKIADRQQPADIYLGRRAPHDAL
uniref:Uncharacterized protein n=1 Tax=Anguilla anguilla TaxID=7936 RepID=A0A0E9T659_ANGAN